MMIRPNAILDTCVLVDILRGKKDLQEKLKELDIAKCAIFDLTRFELLCGAEKSSDRENNIQLVNQLCDRFQIRPTSCGYEHAAKEKVRLQKAGERIADIDLLIGSACAAEGFPLVTGNIKHMERIKDIDIIPW